LVDRLAGNSLKQPKPSKPEITNNKHQITNKIKSQLFGILNFGHCDLFGICVLLFEIFQAVRLNKYLEFQRDVFIHRKGAKNAKV
jgi:hypothetical protein